MNLRVPAGLWPLTLCAALSCAREGDENLGLPPTETAPLAVERRQLQRPQGLLQVAAMPPGEVVRRLGAVRLEAHTSWQITPPARPGVDSAPQAMKEDALIEADGKGGLHVLHENDRGYGSEAVLLGGQLYMRMRYGPYVRRRPEDDEVPRLLAAAGDTSGALLQLLGPWLKIDEASDAKVAGRPAVKLTLSKLASPQRDLVPRAVHLSPGQKWRPALSVASLSGAAVVDATEGALLGLKLEASFQAPRGEGGPPVKIEVSHRAAAGLGEAVSVRAPGEGEVIDPPVRPRPMLDYQELLEGLVPRGQHR